MSRKYIHAKLLSILRLALQTRDVDLRDNSVNYLAHVELPGSAGAISTYLDSEP